MRYKFPQLFVGCAISPPGFPLFIRIRMGIAGLLYRILRFAPGILYFALHLLDCAFGLIFRVTGPFADLTLYPARDVFYFSLYSVLVHHNSSTTNN